MFFRFWETLTQRAFVSHLAEYTRRNILLSRLKFIKDIVRISKYEIKNPNKMHRSSFGTSFYNVLGMRKVFYRANNFLNFVRLELFSYLVVI